MRKENLKSESSLIGCTDEAVRLGVCHFIFSRVYLQFAALTPLEPRLGKKLIEPLTNLIHSTSAMSLLYECINTVIASIPIPHSPFPFPHSPFLHPPPFPFFPLSRILLFTCFSTLNLFPTFPSYSSMNYIHSTRFSQLSLYSIYIAIKFFSTGLSQLSASLMSASHLSASIVFFFMQSVSFRNNFPLFFRKKTELHSQAKTETLVSNAH